MKALITGINGFVGFYLKDELEKNGYTVCGMDIVGGGDVHYADLTDYRSVRDALESAQPGCVFHLAGQSSAGLSWSNPQMTFDVNVTGSLNLLEAVREADASIPILMIGSSDEYGKVGEKDCPLKETFVPRPANPYAISKLAQEELCKLYVEAYGMHIVMTRSFNHTGPRQKKGFVIPDFCSRIVEMEQTGRHIMNVGNLSAKRDFSDVRDIVRAYRLLMERGSAGEIYNVGSGKAYQIRELLEMLVDMSGVEIEIYQDPEKMRPIDLPLIQSDIGKLAERTGYEPEYDIRQTLEGTLHYWRAGRENE